MRVKRRGRELIFIIAYISYNARYAKYGEVKKLDFPIFKLLTCRVPDLSRFWVHRVLFVFGFDIFDVRCSFCTR